MQFRKNFLTSGLKEFKKATLGIKDELKDTTDEVEQSATQDDK